MKITAPTRSHLIHAFEAESAVEALQVLKDAHDFLVRRASGNRPARAYWACIAKRSGYLAGQDVDLRSRADDPAPPLIGKAVEPFCEVVNMTATAQRLIDALMWVMPQERFDGCSVCSDPSTSDYYSDLLLLGGCGLPVARFEAADKNAGEEGIKTKVTDSIRKLNTAAAGDAKRGALTAKFLVGSHEMRRRIRLVSGATWEVGDTTFPTVIGELK